MTNSKTKNIPEPFDRDTFSLLRTGIYDDPSISVYMNATEDFAYLDPLPEMDYASYRPRVESLALKDYKKNLDVYKLRFEKIEKYLNADASVLEIGAGNAGFLAFMHEHLPSIRYSCLEPDGNTKTVRDGYSWLTQLSDFQDAERHGYDIVGFFHVLKHVHEPSAFLTECQKLLKPGGRIIIEIPALADPLLSLYNLQSYEEFFYQKQHPFYYSAKSLERLLENHGFRILEMIPHQRYGLENHLNWIENGKPGGNKLYQNMFAETTKSYRKDLEVGGHADAVIAIVGNPD